MNGSSRLSVSIHGGLTSGSESRNVTFAFVSMEQSPWLSNVIPNRSMVFKKSGVIQIKDDYWYAGTRDLPRRTVSKE